MNLSYFENKTILVTGASGYIGNSILQRLSTVSCKIKALVRNKNSFTIPPANSPAKIDIFEKDIRDKSIWSNLLENVDLFYHLAAQTSSKVANESPNLDLETNLLPILDIIETCRRKNVYPDIIFSGTVTQVGVTKTYPVNEDFKDNPITIYDINKLAAENYLIYYSTQTKGNSCILRLANIFGPGPVSSNADRGIVNFFIKKALKGEDLTIYGKGDFVRDYSYIDDIANAFLLSAIDIDKTKDNYYVIGSGNGYTFKEVVEMIRTIVYKKTGKIAKLVSVVPPEGLSPIESRNFVADSTKFKKISGWESQVSLESGLEKTINYFTKYNS